MFFTNNNVKAKKNLTLNDLDCKVRLTRRVYLKWVSLIMFELQIKYTDSVGKFIRNKRKTRFSEPFFIITYIIITTEISSNDLHVDLDHCIQHP